MKKSTFLIVAILLAFRLYAQGAPAHYNEVLGKFVSYYNAGQPDSIFSMFSPEMKVALPQDKFASTTAQLRDQLGRINKADLVSYNQPIAVYKARFRSVTYLLNLALNSNGQITGLFLKPDEEKSASSSLPVDPSVVETPVTLKTMGSTLSGTLAMPKDASGKVPVVLIISGAGSVDRDGNSPNADLNANTYRMLAYALGKAGIASLRYDKRLVGQSTSGDKEKNLSFEDYVDDATSLLSMLAEDERFSKIVIAGHGQGALVGAIATNEEPIKGYISLEGAGDPEYTMLTNAMKSQPDYKANDIKRMLDSLKKGKTWDKIDISLYSIARPSIQPFIMSWCRYDPQREIKKLKMPVLIIQGTTDLEVGVDNGNKLKANAKSGATYTLIRGMNCVLKDAPADRDKNLATYKDPELPLNQEMVTAVITFIQGLK
jgi:pimeloyl-ACP methyl ester carboxylesterase